MTIGARIRSIRKAARISQVRLAELVGVSSQAVNKWESDTTQPSRENLLKIAEALEISVSMLLQPHILPEQRLTDSIAAPRGVVSGGRVVPLIEPNSIDVDDKFAVQKSVVSCSFPCSPKSYALPIIDNSQEPAIPPGSVVVFDPTINPTPGKFVSALQGGKPIMGVLSCTRPGDNFSRVVTPLNPHWPPWVATEEKPIAIYGVNTERHLAV